MHLDFPYQTKVHTYSPTQLNELQLQSHKVKCPSYHSLCTSNHLQNEQQTTQTSNRRGGATGFALGNSTVGAHPSGQHHPIVTITNSANPHDTRHTNLCTFRFIPSSYTLRPATGRDKLQAQEGKCNNLCNSIVSLRDDGRRDGTKHVAGWNKSERAKVGVLCFVFRVDWYCWWPTIASRGVSDVWRYWWRGQTTASVCGASVWDRFHCNQWFPSPRYYLRRHKHIRGNR
jgi:hypothetical protein